MNKDLLKICFIAALLLSATSAYATGSSNITTSIVLGGGTFSPSNKVNIQYYSTSTAYAAQSKHLNGDRLMATTGVDPKIFYKTSTTGSEAAGLTSETMDFSSNWTSL